MLLPGIEPRPLQLTTISRNILNHYTTEPCCSLKPKHLYTVNMYVIYAYLKNATVPQHQSIQNFQKKY